MDLIDHQEAAKILGILEIAIRQCLLDGKIRLKKGFSFDKRDVITLKTDHSEYLNRLK